MSCQRSSFLSHKIPRISGACMYRIPSKHAMFFICMGVKYSFIVCSVACRDLGLDDVLQSCQTLLSDLEAPLNQSALDYIVNTPFFKHYKPTLQRHIKELTVTQQELMTSWQTVESRVQQVSGSQKYKLKAEKV